VTALVVVVVGGGGGGGGGGVENSSWKTQTVELEQRNEAGYHT
jgi:hypothetical protein